VAATITRVKQSVGKAADTITIVGTGFTDAPSESVVLCRKSGDTAWTAVNASRVAYVSGTELTLTLHATEFDEGGLWDIGVADNGETSPDDFEAQALFFYTAGTFSPDDVIKGALEELYIEGLFMGHTHGDLDIEHDMTLSDVEVDQSLIPVRSIKEGETFQLSVPLAEVTLEHIKEVWGISADIVDLGGGRRRLTFGGDTTVLEKAVMVVVPAGSGKKWAVTFYRCAIISPGALTWSKGEQVDLPLQVTILADTSRAVGDQVGRYEEYTVA
jgi:hypothetical protein